MTLEERARALLALSKYVGCDVTADFIRQTSVHCPAAGIPRIHSLAEGIFKPKDSQYALCIWSRSAAGAESEVYPDDFEQRLDGGWSMHYSAKQGSLRSAVNASLFRCLQDRQPVLVIVTSRGKDSPGGSRYRMLGPALLTAFSEASERFTLTGSTPEVVAPFRDWADEVKLEETYLRTELVLPLTIAEERPRYVTSRKAREQAFRSLILAEYGRLCCLCRSMFVLKDTRGMLVEAEAAHIIPVIERGSDDPRNALSLCKRHHWAFDKGLFTFSDAREALISPAVRRAERQRFDLEEYEGEAMNPPSSESCRPDPMALAWHRDHTFRQ